ncbi:MAG: hypothetical protein AAGA03_15540 [Planctomycetota bacterium]
MDMSETSQPAIDEVDLLLANARLRDELEPYRDDSIDDPTQRRMSLKAENEYLASMLAWERAPALPVAQWFEPPLVIPAPETLDDADLRRTLWKTVDQLYTQRIVLQYTDHLSDRELYRLIYRDILPSCEKKLHVPNHDFTWHCVEDTDTWLRYYADPVERRRYQEDNQAELPPTEAPEFRRQLPGTHRHD